MADALLRLSILHPPNSPLLAPTLNPRRSNLSRKLGSHATAAVLSTHHPKRLPNFKVHAVVAESDVPKWWEKNGGPNMIDIHSTEEFLNALNQAGEKLVIVEFYGTWCGSCRALFPKKMSMKLVLEALDDPILRCYESEEIIGINQLCKTAEEHPDIVFIKVNFDENKPMCKRLNVRVLPYFHFYRGSDGLLESFSCSLAKFQKIKDAIATHNTARCSMGPPLGVGDLNLLETSSTPLEKPAEAGSSSPNIVR